jgi:hypothetical protein
MVVSVAPAAHPALRVPVERHRFSSIPLVWASDSRHVAYLRRLPGSHQLVVAAPTGHARVLVRRVCENAVSWSPNGRRLAVVVPWPHVGCAGRPVVGLDVVGLDGVKRGSRATSPHDHRADRRLRAPRRPCLVARPPDGERAGLRAG